MLKLVGVKKDYKIGNATVNALKGVDLEFRDSEFVAVLGQSGCGKTTLLNIIGGLDRYTEGSLIIDGVDTRDYRDADWDKYRNESIGFVFQSYNLIPHQTVLHNVELALTLSGVSKSDRRARAEKVLKQVGLEDQINKKPNQMSGGQMQRVAIARALVNDPKILLADEPTGALDSETSRQIMDILSEVAKDRLVIMVTHNPELAEQYANRTIRLLDGTVTGDSNPYSGVENTALKGKRKRAKKRSMNYRTALSLSFNNLLTKKARTLLTSFAGSIGIIGIALILSVSSGFQNYVSRVEENTLSAYPITIEEKSMDMSVMVTTMIGVNQDDDADHDLDKVYSNDIMGNMVDSVNAEIQRNDLTSFIDFLNENTDKIDPLITDIKYGYNTQLYIYNASTEDGVMQVNPSTVMDDIKSEASDSVMQSFYSNSNNVDVWSEMLDNNELLSQQYDVLAGRWPENWNEVMLIVDKNNEVSDLTLYTLGVKSREELDQLIESINSGDEIQREQDSYTYDDILNLEFSLLLPGERYSYNEQKGSWEDKSDDQEFMTQAVGNGEKIKIVGIIRPNDNALSTSLSGSVGYTSELVQHVIERINDSELVRSQIENPDTDVFTGLPFLSSEDASELNDEGMTEQQKKMLSSFGTGDLSDIIKQYGKGIISQSTYEDNLKLLGADDLDEPDSISIYPVDFQSKEQLINIIDEYNRDMTDAGDNDKVINYTDYVGMIMSSVSTIINTISYVLIAFVAISLVVSSIMIGIITYISVLERTKEIGILRSIGASKKDISRVFNAETIIEGFTAGIIGIGLTVLLCIPINAIIKNLANISGVAKLPVTGAVILIVISVLLTLVAGLIPSRMAAKRDPVIALRTE